MQSGPNLRFSLFVGADARQRDLFQLFARRIQINHLEFSRQVRAVDLGPKVAVRESVDQLRVHTLPILNLNDLPLPAATILRLREQLDCLETLLDGTAPGALDRRPAPDKWSARENLAHLARYHEMFLERIQRILTEERPSLPRYRAEDDSEWPTWAGMPTAAVLAKMRALRFEFIERVEKLADHELSRTAVHSRFGEMNLIQWLEFFLLHEAHHLYIVMQRVRE